MDALHREAQALSQELKALKDALHRRPEGSFREYETTALVETRLRALGLTPLDLGMDTGAAAVLEGAKPGKTVALRADLDAIAETEAADHCPRSETEGWMHGCGHDFHTACLLGAAKLLSRRRETLSGRIALLFQPGEEVTQGAGAMLAHGLWDRLGGRPGGIFALHCRPELDVGQIAVLEGPIMAGKLNFRVTLRGRAGHGGSPHKCADPIVAGAALVNGLQTIVSRNTDPLDALVCGACSLHTDAPDFFVPAALTMTGSIRFLRPAVGDAALERLRRLAEAVAAGYGCAAEVEALPQVPVNCNHPALMAAARLAAAETVGENGVASPRPDMGSEDFALFGAEVPSFFYWLGTGTAGRENPPWHSPAFQTDDRALPLGAELLARSALAALEPDAPPRP